MSFRSEDPMVWRGPYSGATAYDPDDVVVSGGVQYVCILATTGNAPPNATYWELSADDQVGGGGVKESTSSTTESSSTSATWAQKARLTTSSLASANYKVTAYITMRADANNQALSARLQIDDTTTAGTVHYESRSTTAAANEGLTDTMVWTGSLSGVTNIDVDYCRPSGTGTIYISNVYITIEEF